MLRSSGYIRVGLTTNTDFCGRLFSSELCSAIEPRYDEGLRDWKNMLAKNRFRYIGDFSIYCSISGAKDIIRYIEDFVVLGFVISRVHCRPLSVIASPGKGAGVPLLRVALWDVFVGRSPFSLHMARVTGHDYGNALCDTMGSSIGYFEIA